MLAELGIDIGEAPATSVRDLDLSALDLVVSLGIHKLGLGRHQTAIAWDVPEFTWAHKPTDTRRLRDIRDALAARVRALGAILTAANRA